MIETKFQTIYRYAREALNNSQIRETALAMIAHIAKDEIAEPQLTEEESQLVLGAMPLQGLPNAIRTSTSTWPYCQMGEHEQCGGEASLLRGEINRCDCHQWPEPVVSSEQAWRYIADQRTVRSNYCIRQSGNGDCLAHATTKEIAAQIVRDHQLAALVPRLITELRFLRDTAFAFHVNEKHKPEAFAICEHHVCLRACETWNKVMELTTASREQK